MYTSPMCDREQPLKCVSVAWKQTKPYQAWYVHKPNVWEGSTKIEISYFNKSTEVCECCLKTNENHINSICTQAECVREVNENHCFNFIKALKCVSVLWKHSKAIRSNISRHTESVRGVYESRFFIDLHLQHQIYRRPSSAWVLSENSPNNKRTLLARNRFIVVIWTSLQKVLVLITRNDSERLRSLHQ